MVQHWQLFVDESGDFNEPRDVWVVAGVLIQAEPHVDQKLALRRVLQAAMPGLEYPPHAWLLRESRPAGRLVGYLKCRDPQGRAGVAEHCEPALEALRERNAALARELVECSRGRGEPSSQLLSRCDAWLRDEAPGAFRRLRALVARDVRAMTELLAGTSEIVGAGNAFVVAAVRTPALDDEAQPPSAEPAGDPYVDLLAELHERLLLLLRGDRGAPQQVWVTAASRNVRRPGYPRAVPLFLPELGQAAERAARVPFHRPVDGGSDSVRVRPLCAPPRYDEKVHPGVVLADFVSNRLRDRVRMAHLRWPWRELADASLASFALPVEAAARGLRSSEPLPSVAAAGPARSAVLDALEGRGAAGLESIARTWERDQAKQWIEALR